MTDLVLAADVEVGHHSTAEFLGMTFNTDTILATAIAAVIVISLAFVLRARVTSGVPNGLQLAFEGLTGWVRDQVEASIGLRVAPFVVPLAMTLFVFVLVANWLSVLPAQTASDLIPPPASDTNFTYALALLVFVWTHVAGIRRRGAGRHAASVVKGHVAFLAPINIVEEIAKPVSLSLRLFGNMFAGTVLVTLISLLPAYVLWFPNAVWKTFDLFVGAMQAFIFALLTILYFGQSMETHDEH
jgi:F-type H+-transporting ATPase subunit a